MDLELRGKRALVTGSTSGIGAGIAAVLSGEGVAVAINGRDRARGEAVAQSIREAGGIAVLAIGDLATDDGADAVADAAISGLGGVDILINNAGGRASETGATNFLEVEPSVWTASYEKNVVAAVRLIRRLAPAMVERGWGRLIQISSASGMSPTGATPDYASAKAAMLNLTLGASKALARTGVTVNTVSPGLIYTPGADSWLADIARDQGFGDDRAKTEAYAIRKFVPQTVSRMGQPEDVAAMVAWLASPVADFVNGADFRVDGGVSPSIN